jgi:hypothetical protein
MEVFDIINIQPNESIKVISGGEKDRIKLIRNITHILHARYNMGVIIVSSSYTENKRMKYENIYPTIELFVKAIDRNTIKFNQNTLLVLDDCCDSITHHGMLAKISEDSKFRNIIFCVSRVWSTFWRINTDITFCLRSASPSSIYDQYIDKKTMPLNIFKDICDEYTRDNNILMIDQKNTDVFIRKCICENENTHIDSYNNTFSYDKNVHAVYHIYNNFSVYYDVNSELYNSLWDNINFIVKCSYLIFTFNILRQNPYGCLYLPRELHTIILHSMIQLYQKNDTKDFRKKNDTPNILKLIRNRHKYRIGPDRDD